MQNWVCTNWAPAATFAASLSGRQPSGGSIGRSAAPRKNWAAPGHLAPRRQLAAVADPLRQFGQATRIEVEDRFGLRLVARPWIVSGQQQEVVNSAGRCAHEIRRKRDAIAVAAGELQNRFDSIARQNRSRGERAHMGAGTCPVGHIDRVGKPAERKRFAQEFIRRARDRRRNLRGENKAAGPQRRLQSGGGLVPERRVHRVSWKHATCGRLALQLYKRSQRWP
jgi:hypothetical protein